MPMYPKITWLSIAFVLASLYGCNSSSQTSRVATHELMLNAVVIRHDDQLLVQATVNPKRNSQHNLRLQEQERIDIQLGDTVLPLQAQWNSVYSVELPYQDAPLMITLYRQAGRNELIPIQSTLYLDSPEFLSPQPRSLFQTQSHTSIPLHWHGQPEQRGEYQLFCTDRTQGLTQISGSFATANRQQVDIPLHDLLTQHEALDKRALCEGIFTLRGISTRADMAPELGGGSFLFESNVSRPVVIRHNRIMNPTESS